MAEEENWMPGAETFTALKGQWDSFLEQPGAKTALLQFGINMMQPPSFGDTAFSQMGRAIGAAGEASTRQQVEERKEMEAEAKADVAEMRAYAAQQRAGATGAKTELEREKLGISRERLENQRRQQDLTTRYNLLRGYQSYRREVEKRNAKIAADWNDPIASAIRPKGAVQPLPERVMTEDEFAASPLGRAMIERMGGTAPIVPATPDTPFSTPGTGAPTASPTLTGRPSSGVIDQVPPNPKDRVVGQRYMTPKGVKTWFEDGWE